jgi:hypothetical protein
MKKNYFGWSGIYFIFMLYMMSLWRHERYLFSVFRWILPAIFRRFSKKLSTSVVVHQTIFYQIIEINKKKLVSRGVKFLEKRRENVQIFQALRWRFDIWEAIIYSKTVQISRAIFNEIQKTNNAHDVTITSNTYRTVGNKF